MTTLKTTRNITVGLIAGLAVMVGILVLAGYQFSAKGGMLIVSTGVASVSIPILGYMLTKPGLAATGAVIIALLATYIPKAQAIEITDDTLDMAEDESEDKTLETENAELIAKLTAQAEDFAKEKAYLKRTITELDETISKKDEELSQKAEDIEKANEEVSELNGKIEDMETSVEEVEAENTSLKDMLSDAVSEGEEQKELAEKRLNEIKDMQDADKDKDARIAELEAEIAELKSDLENEKTVSSYLMAEKDSYADRIAELEEAAEEATDEALQRDFTVLNANFEIMKEDYDLLYSRYIEVIEFMLNRKMTTEEAVNREKNRFSRA